MYVFDDLPKDLFDLRKKQLENFKQAKRKGYSAHFSKVQQDKLFVNGKFIAPSEPLHQKVCFVTDYNMIIHMLVISFQLLFLSNSN